MYIKSHRSTLSRDQNTTVEIRDLAKITYLVKSMFSSRTIKPFSLN
ncbi:unnamed protein product [Brassica rapa]|uniref:Uncharacterized protein n=1 Tax=Brassica campestris TaxID=3711 RepID=A0A8D9GRL2_BRACM|nr:unnamed protein product [Brassica rapa]